MTCFRTCLTIPMSIFLAYISSISSANQHPHDSCPHYNHAAASYYGIISSITRKHVANPLLPLSHSETLVKACRELEILTCTRFLQKSKRRKKIRSDKSGT
ncbi:hypothetical protein F5Y01DRAFT_278324 [Xylaria sp. FL0043]|nr:hypothetical protein F5Y01DRAFT_278324 [Xylaria sp. FL0043]